MRVFISVLCILFMPLVGFTDNGYSEPPRGSATRAALMDAIRPHAEWMLGAPVAFVVSDLRVAGNLAFAMLRPQRPDGRMIDPAKTPMVLRGGADPEMMDGVAIQALYRKSGDTWVAVHWAIGATDVWFSSPDLCEAYRRVIPDYCR